MLLHHYICIVLFGISISFAVGDVGPISKHLRLSSQPDLGRGEASLQGQKQRVHNDFKREIAADQPNIVNRPQSLRYESGKPLRRNKRYSRKRTFADVPPVKRRSRKTKGEAEEAKKKKKTSGGWNKNVILGVFLGIIGLGIGGYLLYKYKFAGKNKDKKGKGKGGKDKKAPAKNAPGKKAAAKKAPAKKKKAKLVEEDEEEDEENEGGYDDEGEGEGEGEGGDEDEGEDED